MVSVELEEQKLHNLLFQTRNMFHQYDDDDEDDDIDATVFSKPLFFFALLLRFLDISENT